MRNMVNQEDLHILQVFPESYNFDDINRKEPIDKQ